MQLCHCVLPQPLCIACYVAFWSLAATPSAAAILILALGGIICNIYLFSIVLVLVHIKNPRCQEDAIIFHLIIWHTRTPFQVCKVFLSVLVGDLDWIPKHNWFTYHWLQNHWFIGRCSWYKSKVCSRIISSSVSSYKLLLSSHCLPTIDYILVLFIYIFVFWHSVCIWLTCVLAGMLRSWFGYPIVFFAIRLLLKQGLFLQPLPFRMGLLLLEALIILRRYLLE